MFECEKCGESTFGEYGSKLYEDCFEEGLIEDMNDHFKYTIEKELKEWVEDEKEVLFHRL